MVHPETVGSARLLPVDFPPEGDRLLAFNPPGTRLAVSCQDTDHVQVFDPRSGKEVTRITDFFRISGIAFLSAEVLLVTAFGGCMCCDLRRGTRGLLSPGGWQTSTTVSPNGRLVALGVKWGVELYDVRKGQVVRNLIVFYDPDHYGHKVAFSPGYRYVAVGLRGGAARPSWSSGTCKAGGSVSSTPRPMPSPFARTP